MKSGKSNRRLEMSPDLPAAYITNCGLVQSVSLGDCCLGHLRIQTADDPDIVVGEFRQWVRHAVRMAKFASFVRHVVLVVASKQVCRVTAGRVIAAVQDIRLWRHMPASTFVGDSMRAQLSALLVAYNSVPVTVFGSSPRPTVVGFTGMVIEQEAFSQRHQTGAVAARFRAIGSSWSAWRTQVAMCAEFHSRSVSPMGNVK